MGFGWFDAPKAQAIEASTSLLERLGALENGTITEIGRQMIRIPAHPRVSRMLIEAQRLGVLEDAATLAATITEGRQFEQSSLDALQALDARLDEPLRKVRTQFLSAFEKLRPATAERPGSRMGRFDSLRFALLCGFPDRVARKRADQDPNAAELELLLASGGSARIPNSAAVSGADTFVILDLQEKQGRGQNRTSTYVQTLSEIKPEWLFDLVPTSLKESEEAIWDTQRKRVRVASRLLYDQLCLSESRAELVADSPVAQVAAGLMLKEAFGLDAARILTLTAHDLLRELASSADPETLESLLTRISWVSKTFPEHGFPDFLVQPLSFGPILLRLMEGKSSLDEIQSLDWETAILAACGDMLPRQLEELTPTSIALPSGRRARVHYKFTQAPWVESRLQDFLGMKKGPAILRGRVPLTLHLLAPNGRAVQVTTDLEGFWSRAYPELRQQLSRRYPRHSWPEKP